MCAGSSSEVGHKGCCSCPGPQGPQGIQGMQGLQGVQGTPGLNGLPGLQGPSGPIGLQGLQGAAGPMGATGPQGASGASGLNGLPGAQGSVGSQGPSGADGAMGPVGPQGPQGIAGPQGMQGLQGIPGKDCDGSQALCCERYANIYASIAQVIGPYSSPADMVLFDQTNSVSAGDFDLSAFGTTGDIKFLKHGIYHVQWQLQARITPPVPNPVPSWSFGFFVNGILMPGSIYSGFTQAPGDDACHSTGDVIFEFKAGDLLKLRNTSVSSVNLNPLVTGSVFPITIASVNIECLKALP